VLPLPQVRAQLQGPLATAAEELAAEEAGAEAGQPSPAEVAAAVEAAMYQHFGGSRHCATRLVYSMP